MDLPVITVDEKKYLRELAKKQLEYAKLPVMEGRRKLWHAHNTLKKLLPVVVMEEETFMNDIIRPPVCTTPLAKELERTMCSHLANHEHVDDDKVIPDEFYLNLSVNFREFGLDWKIIKIKEDPGSIAYQFEHAIKDLETEIEKLKTSEYSYDAGLNRLRHEMAQDAIGDILPVTVKNKNLEWYMTLTYKVINLMGMENMMLEMALNPEKFHELMSFITKDINKYLDWLEDNNLLTLNNGNDFAGAGSYGFTDEIGKQEGSVRTKDLWGNFNSQESSTISPEMYGELIFPYYKQLMDRFGLVYYGCCEPVHPIWEKYLSRQPNLRKVSVSAWCNEEYMGNMLRDSNTIYSRKPSPNFIGIEKVFDEDAFRAHIKKTLLCGRGCEIEFIFRDIYTLVGDLTKPGRAVKIVRELVERYYQ